MSDKEKSEFVYDHDEAWKIFKTPVQCGECYCFYEPLTKNKCPVCGSTEW